MEHNIPKKQGGGLKGDIKDDAEGLWYSNSMPYDMTHLDDNEVDSLDMTHKDKSVWSLGYDAPRQIQKINGYYTPLKEKWESLSRFQK